MNNLILLLLLVGSSSLLADDVKLSDLVAAAASLSSESNKIRAEIISKDANVIRVESALAPQVTGKISVLDNRNEPAGGAFSPERMQKTSFNFGIRKLFATGTVVGSEVNLFDNATTFPASLSASGFAPPAEFKESNFSVFVQQKLLKNSFGSAYRAKEEAAVILANSLSDTITAKMETYISGLIEQYYAIWRLKVSYEAAQDRLVRQMRLLKVTRIKMERGTAEEPDLLQLQSSLEQVKIQISDVKKGLEDSWRMLVISLNLPDEYLNVPIDKINLLRDSRVSESTRYCTAKSFPETTTIKALKASLSATSKELLAVKSEARPDVFFEARVTGNGIDESLGSTVSDAVTYRHPQLSIAIGLDWSLGFHTEKAAYLEAYKRQKIGEASLDQMVTNQKIEYKNACADLARLSMKVASSNQVYKWQKKRNELEERRFALGQVDLFNVIQAGNDERTALVELKSSYSELDLAAWKILELHGELPAYIQTSVQKYKKASK